MRILLSSAVLLIVPIAAVVLRYSGSEPEARSVFHSPDVLTNPYAVIAHGGGAIDGHSVTDSREAVESSVKRGMKSIEIDFHETSDGRLIGQHDEESFKSAGIEDVSKLAPDELFSLKFYGKYHPASADHLNKMMDLDKSLVLVTDKIRNYRAIKAQLRFKDRVYVEVPNFYYYLQARMTGIVHPMLRMSNKLPWVFAAFIHAFEVKLITVKREYLVENLAFYQALKAKGVCALVYTVDDWEFIDRYKDALCAIYSNTLGAPRPTSATLIVE